MPDSNPRIVRVFPRLCMGGAENAIVQLLEHVGDTHMVVTHIDGMRAEEAKQLADRYTLLSQPRFYGLLSAMSEAEIVHIHTINDHPLVPLAAQLSGAPVILQTVHNQLSPQYCHFVDHSILVGDELMDRVVTPQRCTVIPNGIPCPDALPPLQPWCAPQSSQPLTLLEMRREDKGMRWTLAQLLATGEFDDLDVRCQVLGFHGESSDSRLQYLGPMANPYPLVAQADFLVMGTETETFGRTVYEAMAWGALPITTPIDAFTRVFSTEQVAYIEGDVHVAARQIRAHIQRYTQDPTTYNMRRDANHVFVRDRFSVRRMAQRTEAVYRDLTSTSSCRPQSFSPADLEEGDVHLFGELVDDVLDSNPPQRLREINKLTPPMQGMIYWLLVASGKARPDTHIALLQAAMDRLGSRFILNLRLGEQLVQAGKFTEAIRSLERARLSDPNNIAPVLGLADAWIQIQRPDMAQRVIQEGISHSPQCQYLGTLAARLHQFGQPGASP